MNSYFIFLFLAIGVYGSSNGKVESDPARLYYDYYAMFAKNIIGSADSELSEEANKTINSNGTQTISKFTMTAGREQLEVTEFGEAKAELGIFELTTKDDELLARTTGDKTGSGSGAILDNEPEAMVFELDETESTTVAGRTTTIEKLVAPIEVGTSSTDRFIMNEELLTVTDRVKEKPTEYRREAMIDEEKTDGITSSDLTTTVNNLVSTIDREPTVGTTTTADKLVTTTTTTTVSKTTATETLTSFSSIESRSTQRPYPPTTVGTSIEPQMGPLNRSTAGPGISNLTKFSLLSCILVIRQ